MAYLRGDYYLWADDHRLHLWADDGYGAWDADTGWYRAHAIVSEDGECEASGVSIPMDVADEFVVTRLAQLIYEGKLSATIHRVVDKGRNVGGMMLARNADVLERALADLHLEPAPPYVRDGSRRDDGEPMSPEERLAPG